MNDGVEDLVWCPIRVHFPDHSPHACVSLIFIDFLFSVSPVFTNVALGELIVVFVGQERMT